ncbi:MAG: hypothetical protein CG439_2851 [Methylococcaceae bacterium NSP1-2]|nr:hypothetical protein [Methylococcaceae bacterium]OYV15235.1 MAG: hypothetical protein CG439_2851 [Methylococcaceae bacterium NSP1-2]
MSSPPPLPDVLTQLKEVRSEAAELRNFTITFLSLLLYIDLIIAGTDAEQILRVAPVTLPLLNVPLPIIGFYGFVPWLLLLFHLNSHPRPQKSRQSAVFALDAWQSQFNDILCTQSDYLCLSGVLVAGNVVMVANDYTAFALASSWW